MSLNAPTFWNTGLQNFDPIGLIKIGGQRELDLLEIKFTKKWVVQYRYTLEIQPTLDFVIFVLKCDHVVKAHLDDCKGQE